MIRPPRGSCFFINRMAWCAQRNAPVRFVSTICRQPSTVSSSTAPAGPNAPALLTSKSSRSQRLATAAKSAATDAGTVTSVGITAAASAGHPPPVTVSASACSRRPAAATRQPALSSSLVMARPSPDPAPVTTATPVAATIAPFGAKLPLARLAAGEHIAPVALGHLNVELLRRLDDPLPGLVALRVGDTLDLVEARDRVPHVAGVGERFLALPGEGELRAGQLVLLGGAQTSALTRDLLAVCASALRLPCLDDIAPCRILLLRGGHHAPCRLVDPLHTPLPRFGGPIPVSAQLRTMVAWLTLRTCAVWRWRCRALRRSTPMGSTSASAAVASSGPIPSAFLASPASSARTSRCCMSATRRRSRPWHWASPSCSLLRPTTRTGRWCCCGSRRWTSTASPS